jgi:hypothetical protein
MRLTLQANLPPAISEEPVQLRANRLQIRDLRSRKDPWWSRPEMRESRVQSLYVRESIFIKSHTSEFCGKKKYTHEPDVADLPPQIARWVYERGNPGRHANGESGSAAAFGLPLQYLI